MRFNIHAQADDQGSDAQADDHGFQHEVGGGRLFFRVQVGTVWVQMGRSHLHFLQFSMQCVKFFGGVLVSQDVPPGETFSTIETG